MPKKPPLPSGTFLAILLIFTALVFLAHSGCYMRPKPPATLRILFTSETQGMFTPCGCVDGPRGGFEKRSTAIRQARASAPGPVILLDTGNFSTGVVTDSERLKAEFVTTAMASLDYDAVNVGLRDAKRPRLGVLTYNSEGCPLISAGFSFIDENNEYETSEVIGTTETGVRKYSYPSHKIIEIDGWKIGIIGSPLSDERPDIVGFQNEPDVTVEELYHLMDNLQVTEGIGTFIVLSDLDSSPEIVSQIAMHLPLATILIAGRSAQPDFKEEKNSTEVESWPIIIPHAETWGRSLGVLDLEFTRQGGIAKYHLEFINLDDKVEKDPAFAELTEQYLARMNELGSNLVPQIRNTGFVGTKECKDCHLPQYEDWSGSLHARAWDTLEKTGRIGESGCVPCHTTGYAGLENMPDRLVPFEFRNVGCESCHGPGRTHIEYQQWKIYGSLTGENRGEDMTDPIVKTPSEAVCTGCHKAPYDEGWIFETKIDRIDHR